jgi:prolyl-tRNA synthetase
VGAAIEQSHDERGIVFPEPIAPFHVALVPIGYGKSAAVREAADALYREFSDSGVEVLLDDRDERPGVMFADMELIGIPHRVVVGERSLKEGLIEYQGRRDKEPKRLPQGEVVSQLTSKLC